MQFSINRKNPRGISCWTAVALVVYEVDAWAAGTAATSWWEEAQCFFDDGCGVRQVVGKIGMLLEQIWDCRQIRSQ